MSEQQRLYWVWCDMRYRCKRSQHRGYPNYGGRGIAVCERWQKLANFLADMGPRPIGGLLERRNNDGNYEPSNCYWATRKEQNSNRRNCIYIDDRGEQVTLKEYCRRHGLKYRPIVKRIQDRNWPLAMALSEPVRPGKRFQRVPA
jgi:hypothetical protein